MALVRTDPSGRPATSVSERIVAAFQTLTESAENINSASNELGKPIASLDRALKRLNLGVACWTTISHGGSENGPDYWSRQVGYARVRRIWCLAIRTLEGDVRYPDEEIEEVWSFNEAPKHLRVKAVDKLPELIEALVEATNATAKRLTDKVAGAQDIAAAVNALVTPKKKAR